MKFDLQRCIDSHPYWLSCLNRFSDPELNQDTYQHRDLIHSILTDKSHTNAEKNLSTLENGEHPRLSRTARHIRALIRFRFGQHEEAIKTLREVIRDEPVDAITADLLFNLATMEIHQRKTSADIYTAVSLLQRSLEITENFAPSHAALGLIFSIAGDYSKAKFHGQKAIDQGYEVGNRLLELVVWQSCFLDSGKTTKPFLLDCDANFTELNTLELLSNLPKVEFIKDLDPRASHIFFVACDAVYFSKYALHLVESIFDRESSTDLHIHIYNPNETTKREEKILNGICASRQLTISYENVDVSRYGGASVYYSCARYIRFYQFCKTFPHCAITILDADLLVNQGFSDLLLQMKYQGFDVALVHKGSEPIWGKYTAALASHLGSAKALIFWKHVACVLLTNLIDGGSRWFLDQVALYSTARKFKKEIAVATLEPRDYLDEDLQHKSYVWVAVNKEKHSQNRFTDRRRLIGERLTQLAIEADNNCKIVRSKYGVMLINKNDRFIGRSIATTGTWCEHEIMLLRQILRTGDVVVDAGANIGSHTVAFARLCGPEGRVYAFEPQRIIFQQLCCNVALNGLTNVETMHLALSKTQHAVEIPPLDYNREGNFGAVCLKDTPITGLETTQAIPLDSLEISQCRLIKADVEGMEEDVLSGALLTIERCRPFLYLEYHQNDSDSSLLQLVRNLNYHIFKHGGPNDPNIFCVPKEIQLNISGFAKANDR